MFREDFQPGGYSPDAHDPQPHHSPLNPRRDSVAWPWAAALTSATLWAAIVLLLLTFGAGPLWR